MVVFFKNESARIPWIQGKKVAGILLLVISALLPSFKSTMASGNQSQNNIDLVDPQIQSSSIHVGDSFRLSVLVVNSSPNHPTADGRLFGELLVGDTLDGSKIQSVA